MPRGPKLPCRADDACDRPVVARGLCAKHYGQSRYRGDLRAKVLTVTADYSYPDNHPQARGGQRIAVYTCPACKKQHMVSWLPFDENPGLKMATCIEKTPHGSSGGVRQFLVLAPPAECVYTEKPKPPETVTLGA